MNEAFKELIRHYGAWLVIGTPAMLIWMVWSLIKLPKSTNTQPQRESLGIKSFDVESTPTGSFFLNLYENGTRVEHLEFFRPRRVVIAYGREWLNDNG